MPSPTATHGYRPGSDPDLRSGNIIGEEGRTSPVNTMMGSIIVLVMVIMTWCGTVGAQDYTPRVHIVTCETRADAAAHWHLTVQEVNGAAEVQNICEGLDWSGTIMKPRQVIEYMETLLAAGAMPDDLIMFVDGADALFNLGSTHELVTAYKTAAVEKPILISTELTCFCVHRAHPGAENVRPAYHGMATQDGSQTARPSSKYRRSKAGSASGQPNSARAATRQHDPQLPINPPSHPVPITPQNAVKMYQGQLSNYELSEVLDYPQIYYVGTAGQKVRNTSVNKVRARAR